MAPLTRLNQSFPAAILFPLQPRYSYNHKLASSELRLVTKLNLNQEKQSISIINACWLTVTAAEEKKSILIRPLFLAQIFHRQVRNENGMFEDKD